MRLKGYHDMHTWFAGLSLFNVNGRPFGRGETV